MFPNNIHISGAKIKIRQDIYMFSCIHLCEIWRERVENILNKEVKNYLN